jgi:hypothetical protein
MIDNDDVELRLAAALSPMLITVSVFSLTAMVAVSANKNTIIDELLGIIAVFCIFSATLVIDSVLDKQNLSFVQRFRFLGGGYFTFCVAVGSMTAFVPILYEAKHVSTDFGFSRHFIFFLLAGLSVSLKMMINKDKGILILSMVLFYALSFYFIIPG